MGVSPSGLILLPPGRIGCTPISALLGVTKSRPDKMHTRTNPHTNKKGKCLVWISIGHLLPIDTGELSAMKTVCFRL
jgi:hypothetical protein